MRIKHRYHHSFTNEIIIEETESCPMCKTKIKPEELCFNFFKDNQDNPFLSIMFLCKHCYRSFVSLYSLKRNDRNEIWASELIYVEPNFYIKKEFDQDIIELSPMFTQVYNEALQAESLNMLEIAGIGYRKSFEFLVKDFFIKLYPTEEAKTEIITTQLSKFFSDKEPSKYKLRNEMLNELALASAWIGNDYAHYCKKYQSFDIDDLKELINATLSQISVELFTLKKAKNILGK